MLISNPFKHCYWCSLSLSLVIVSGAVRNATLCPGRSQRCPQHTDEQRRAVRVFLLGPSAWVSPLLPKSLPQPVRKQSMYHLLSFPSISPCTSSSFWSFVAVTKTNSEKMNRSEYWELMYSIWNVLLSQLLLDFFVCVCVCIYLTLVYAN